MPAAPATMIPSNSLRTRPLRLKPPDWKLGGDSPIGNATRPVAACGLQPLRTAQEFTAPRPSGVGAT